MAFFFQNPGNANVFGKTKRTIKIFCENKINLSQHLPSIMIRLKIQKERTISYLPPNAICDVLQILRHFSQIILIFLLNQRAFFVKI